MNRFDLLKIIFKNLSTINIERIEIKKKKENLSPVTTVDIINQYIIETSIKYFYPNDKVLAEEDLQTDFSKKVLNLYDSVIYKLIKNIKNEFNKESIYDNDKIYVWHIDPLDGTKGFIDNLIYSVAIAITFQENIISSGILSFNLDKLNSVLPRELLVVASLDKVEILDKNLNFIGIKIKDLHSQMKLAISRKHKSNKLIELLCKKNIKCIEMDSQAKYISIVLGLADGYVREKGACGKSSQDFTWDHLPGIHILNVNNNYVLDYNENPVSFKDNEIYFKKYIIAAKNKNTYIKIKHILKELDE